MQPSAASGGQRAAEWDALFDARDNHSFHFICLDMNAANGWLSLMCDSDGSRIIANDGLQ